MNLTCLQDDIAFWDQFAPWYDKWVSRGAYHTPLLRELSQMVEPQWRILDIGAGTGALSIPILSIGCDVTALEPSVGMRRLFNRKCEKLFIADIDFMEEKWENQDLKHIRPFDLIIACNSIHLTEGGIMEGMSRVFSSLPQHACLITEVNQGFPIDFKNIDKIQDTHNFLFIKNIKADSSFIFKDMEEAQNFSDTFGIPLHIDIYDGIPVQRDKTDIAMIWWERKRGIGQSG